jgi:hypothetical protein
VLQWFRFKDEYLERAAATRETLLRQTGAEQLVSVHLRLNNYRIHGLELHPAYWRRAIREMRSRFKALKLCIVVFSDELPRAMRMLGPEKDLVPHAGKMLDDLCLMTLCDSHIISNSTFAWWGAWLAQPGRGLVMRPSIWPIGTGFWRYGPSDFFPADWIAIPARRERTQIVPFLAQLVQTASQRALARNRNRLRRLFRRR